MFFFGGNRHNTKKREVESANGTKGGNVSFGLRSGTTSPPELEAHVVLVVKKKGGKVEIQSPLVTVYLGT